MKKNIYAVLGLARSGTSAVTRSLQALGIDLGDKLQPAGENNPTGFYEDTDIMYKVNRGISLIINDVWMPDDAMTPQKSYYAELCKVKESTIKILQQRLQNTNDWGFKDTRTGNHLPFWHEVFKDMDVQDKYIIVIRHPLARGYSNQKFNHADIESGLIEFLIYLFKIVHLVRNKKHVVVSYELMMQDPRQQLERIHDQLGLAQPLNDESVKMYTDQFLDHNLRHYEYNESDLLQHPAIKAVPHCIEAYSLIMQVARDEKSLNDSEFIAAWENLKQAYQQDLPLYHYANTLLRDEKEIKRERQRIETSLPWKLLLPLRMINLFLKKIGNNIKNKQWQAMSE